MSQQNVIKFWVDLYPLFPDSHSVLRFPEQTNCEVILRQYFPLTDRPLIGKTLNISLAIDCQGHKEFPSVAFSIFALSFIFYPKTKSYEHLTTEAFNE